VIGLALNGEGLTSYVHMTYKKRAWKHTTSGFRGDVATQ